VPVKIEPVINHCPFCGCRGKIIRGCNAFSEKTKFAVYCSSLDCNVRFPLQKTRIGAIKKWNSRSN